MSSIIDRTVIAQVVIALAACIGAWFVFVEPRSVEAQFLEEEIRAGSQQAAGIDQEMVQRLAERLDEVRTRVRQVEQRGEITRDSSHLYSVVMNLARAHDVTVASLNPGSPAAARTGRSPRTGGRADDELAVHREFSVSVSGRYADIARFVNALQSLSGYLEVQYLSIAAASGEAGIVNARLTCRTVRFTLPESLRRMLGGSPAEAVAPAGGSDDA